MLNCVELLDTGKQLVHADQQVAFGLVSVRADPNLLIKEESASQIFAQFCLTALTCLRRTSVFNSFTGAAKFV